jgi:hypothetical protein
LEQSGIHTDVEIEVHGDHLTIRTAPRIRTGWDEAFATMAKQHDDVLLVKRFDVFLVNLDPTVGREIQKTRPYVSRLLHPASYA